MRAVGSAYINRVTKTPNRGAGAISPVTATLTTYRPAMIAENAWQLVRGEVLELVIAAQPATAVQARQLAGYAAAFAVAAAATTPATSLREGLLGTFRFRYAAQQRHVNPKNARRLISALDELAWAAADLPSDARPRQRFFATAPESRPHCRAAAVDSTIPVAVWIARGTSPCRLFGSGRVIPSSVNTGQWAGELRG